MNILVVSAHHDDLELGCGGTMARFVEQGHKVVSLVLTNSGYSNPDGQVIRAPEVALAEAQQAAKVLGYELLCYDEDTLDLQVSDRSIGQIIRAIHQHQIDTIFTHWHGDSHPPHANVNRMVLHAARRVANVFGFLVNWYQGAMTYDPRYFVQICDEHWAKKIRARGLST